MNKNEICIIKDVTQLIFSQENGDFDPNLEVECDISQDYKSNISIEYFYYKINYNEKIKLQFFCTENTKMSKIIKEIQIILETILNN